MVGRRTTCQAAQMPAWPGKPQASRTCPSRLTFDRRCLAVERLPPAKVPASGAAGGRHCYSMDLGTTPTSALHLLMCGLHLSCCHAPSRTATKRPSAGSNQAAAAHRRAASSSSATHPPQQARLHNGHRAVEHHIHRLRPVLIAQVSSGQLGHAAQLPLCRCFNASAAGECRRCPRFGQS